MHHRKIGTLEVSLVGLGCNNFGMRIDAAQARKVVDAALDAGITFFDTADVYGGTKSEEMLGAALEGRRDQVVVATKFASPIGDDPAHSGASGRWIKQAVEDSLRRLRTDYIDLYQQHRPDKDVGIEETLTALDQLVQAGKVREIGCSNFSAAQIQEAETTSARKGLAHFVSVQNQLNLLQRAAVEDVLPECERRGLGFLPFFPLASGLLTGKYRRGQDAPEGTRLHGRPEIADDATFDQLEAAEELARSRGVELIDLAIAGLAAQPMVASVIAGATGPEQVRANAAALSWTPSAADLQELDSIFPTPRHRS
jgi:aryl-alcohol dehydrogenase-like predicted oxidoreductase